MAHISQSTEARIHTNQNWRLRLEVLTTSSTASIASLTTDSSIDFRDPTGTTGGLSPVTRDSTRFVFYDVTSETTKPGDWYFNSHIIIGATTYIGNAMRMKIFRPGFTA